MPEPLTDAELDDLSRVLGSVASLEFFTSRLIAQAKETNRLAAFKAYVHRRLDDAGVPADPESSHRADGCRIGGRLDVLIGERDAIDWFVRLITSDPDGEIDWPNIRAFLQDLADQIDKWRDGHAETFAAGRKHGLAEAANLCRDCATQLAESAKEMRAGRHPGAAADFDERRSQASHIAKALERLAEGAT